MQKLLAIDGLNIVRRVYEANRDEPDSADKAEKGIRNALSSFRKILAAHEPTHALVAFDYGGPTWRHALYPQYREARKPMPVELREALPRLYRQLGELGLATVCVPGVEADDVLGTVTLRWLGEGRGEAIVATTDKDLHVLVAQGALIWDHFSSEYHDRAWIEKRFGVPPELLADYLALMGDATDSIPGVSRIGGKTASKLLNTYKSLDGVMAGAGILMNPVGAKLRQDAAMARLSRQLVQLKNDVKVGITWRSIAYPARLQ